MSVRSNFIVASTALLLLLLATSTTRVQGESVTLTIKNFEQQVEGKAVFIKFFAPWCGHCRAMSEDWDKLAASFAGHPFAFVGEVDCTSDEGQPICQDFDVQGFPTLVYGDPMSAETYDGPRDYDSLKAFADKHITQPICSVHKVDNCDATEKEMITALQSKTIDELEEIVAEVESKVKEQEKTFDEQVAVIQKQYDQLVENFNKNLDAIKKEHNYKFVEQIMTIRQGDGSEGTGDEL